MTWASPNGDELPAAHRLRAEVGVAVASLKRRTSSFTVGGDRRRWVVAYLVAA